MQESLISVFLNGQKIAETHSFEKLVVPSFISGKEKQAISNCIYLLKNNQFQKEWIKLKDNTTLLVKISKS